MTSNRRRFDWKGIFVAVPHPIAREKTDDEYTDAENLKEQFDIQVAGILSQGLPRRIFNILNRTSTAKEIWDSLELLMKGSGKTLEHRKEDMFDEYERFRANGKESIQAYFIRFHKLVNDMKLEQSSSSDVDPLAYLAKSSTPPQPSRKPITQAAQTHEEALMATMQQLANLLSGFQKQFSPTNNQLKASSNPRSQATVQAGQIVTEIVQRSALGNVGKQGKRENQANGSKIVCYNCRGEGHVARQCKEPKRARNSQWYADKALLLNPQEKGEANHEDAYDSDVDDGPDASIVFLANFSSAGSPSSSNNISINEVQTNDA
nr:hypothetical protein [Tanacetum cinerariifolium]